MAMESEVSSSSYAAWMCNALVAPEASLLIQLTWSAPLSSRKAHTSDVQGLSHPTTSIIGVPWKLPC
jgi:hypothetical protein